MTIHCQIVLFNQLSETIWVDNDLFNNTSLISALKNSLLNIIKIFTKFHLPNPFIALNKLLAAVSASAIV